MNEPDFYTPTDIPENIRAFDAETRQLAVGTPGKNGSLRLVFQNDGSGRTVLAEQYSEVPLHAQRAMHFDESCPGMAHLYVISASGGIIQGDRYRIDIAMKDSAMAHITTQGATRIYHMDANSATQMVNITLEENSYLEFVPDQIIPYRNSRFYQRLNLNVHDSATLIYSEILTPGRVAMGESFQYDICHLRTVAANQDGVLRLADTANMEPGRQRLGAAEILGGMPVVGSVYVLARKNDIPALYEGLTDVISKRNDVYGGASISTGNGGLLVRLLGTHAEPVKDTVMQVLARARKTCTGCGFSDIRKN